MAYLLQEIFNGFTYYFQDGNWKTLIMYLIGAILIYLAIKKQYEPALLLPIGFGAILVNLPWSFVWQSDGGPGFLQTLYDAGIRTELFPLLIFIAIGAMVDFTPLFKNPMLIFYGAAAQFGIFATFFLTLFLLPYIGNVIDLGIELPNTFQLAAAIGIIGTADGPTTIYVANRFFGHNELFRPIVGAITVSAYSYMSLVPIIQPPIVKALTTKKDRLIRMDYEADSVPQRVKILFPILITIIAGILVPMSAPLVGCLMFGNLLRECGVLGRLSQAAQNELSSLVTILLGITIGATMKADGFINLVTLLILFLGLLAFIFDTAFGVLFGRFLNLFLKKKINPMIGASGVSAFPMSARVVQKMAKEEDPTNFILMQATGANVSGQLGSIVAGGFLIALVGMVVGTIG